MNTLLHRIMNKWKSYAEEVQGYLGLFLIGAMSWSCQTSDNIRKWALAARPEW